MGYKPKSFYFNNLASRASWKIALSKPLKNKRQKKQNPKISMHYGLDTDMGRQHSGNSMSYMRAPLKIRCAGLSHKSLKHIDPGARACPPIPPYSTHPPLGGGCVHGEGERSHQPESPSAGNSDRRCSTAITLPARRH